MDNCFTSEILNVAEGHVGNILKNAIEYSTDHQAMIIYDTQCELTQVLAEIYRKCLPDAKYVNFDEVSQESILADFETLNPSDLTVLIQSTSFRLDKFRIRVSLFNKSIKVIEHPHLARIPGDQRLLYLDALAYDPDYYRGTGRKLKERIDQAKVGEVQSTHGELLFPVGFEEAKLNVGDYTGMRNVGGQFPIGEVFTESMELEAVNGEIEIFAFGDTTFSVNTPAVPITLVVEKGRVVDTKNSTAEFDTVLENIRRDEDGEVWVRELGFGMNRAFSREKVVDDIGTYERMCGVHLSLGAKHNMYKKPGFKFTPRTSKHHVDVFVDTQAVLLDGQNIYQNQSWTP